MHGATKAENVVTRIGLFFCWSPESEIFGASTFGWFWGGWCFFCFCGAGGLVAQILLEVIFSSLWVDLLMKGLFSFLPEFFVGNRMSD